MAGHTLNPEHNLSLSLRPPYQAVTCKAKLYLCSQVGIQGDIFCKPVAVLH